MASRAIYEIANINPETKEITRGGIRATLETVRRWCDINHANDGGEYFPVLADENAITYREYIKEAKSVRDREE